MVKKLVPATLLATLAFAAPAAAQSVALSVAPDPVEDVPFLVTATGVGVKGYNVYATIKPVGAVGCGAELRHRSPTAAASCTAWRPRAPTPRRTRPWSRARAPT